MQNKIAYTVGNASSYDMALKINPPVYKLGKTEDYGGGICWQTAEEAVEFLESDFFKTIDWGNGLTLDPKIFAVYLLELPNGWDEDTYNNPEYKSGLLLKDAVVIKKVIKEKV